MEEATKKANIFEINDYVILNIVRFLDTQDRIAFAFTCERFRRICVDNSWVFRKVDLSGHLISKMQRCAISKFFGDKEIAQQITDLNISNVRVFNWQMDDQLEDFIVSICPHLEALHILNCGMSFQTLHRILQKASSLTSLSWSLWDITSKDIEFLMKCIKSADEICFKNIKHLHLEIFPSKSHVQILKYLVLSCCRDLEELQIYTWQVDEDYFTGQEIPLQAHETIPGFPLQFTSIRPLQLLHSLTVVELGSTLYTCSLPRIYREELRGFICSVVSSSDVPDIRIRIRGYSREKKDLYPYPFPYPFLFGRS